MKQESDARAPKKCALICAFNWPLSQHPFLRPNKTRRCRVVESPSTLTITACLRHVLSNIYQPKSAKFCNVHEVDTLVFCSTDSRVKIESLQGLERVPNASPERCLCRFVSVLAGTLCKSLI